MNTKTVNFKNQSGLELAAKLELPIDSEPHNYVLFSHCFTCNKDFLAVRNISRALTQHGFGVLRFDFTGLGNSEGDFEDSTFSNNVQDLICAFYFLAEYHKVPSIIVGHSLGGAASLFAGGLLPEIKAITTIGSPSYPGHVTHLFQDQISEIKTKGEAKVQIAGRPFNITKEFLEDLDSTNAQDVIRKLKKALLVMHSPQDSIVGIENAKAIYDAAMHPKSFISLDGADHLLTNNQDAIYAGAVIANWASRYVDLPETNKVATNHQVVAKLEDTDIYSTDIQAGIHSMVADEPEEMGGKNFGPSPYDFVSSGLAACTAITLKMYANHKGWSLEDVRVHVNYFKDYPQDPETAEQGKIDHFERSIELHGELDYTQKERLLQIANKCPVHKTLESTAEVTTKLH